MRGYKAFRFFRRCIECIVVKGLVTAKEVSDYVMLEEPDFDPGIDYHSAEYMLKHLTDNGEVFYGKRVTSVNPYASEFFYHINAQSEAYAKANHAQKEAIRALWLEHEVAKKIAKEERVEKNKVKDAERAAKLAAKEKIRLNGIERRNLFLKSKKSKKKIISDKDVIVID